MEDGQVELTRVAGYTSR